MRYFLLIALLFVIHTSVSQTQKKFDPVEYHNQLENLFSLIFSDPQNASRSLRLLLKDEAKVHDTLLSITWNYLGVYFGVTNQPDSSLYAFDKSLSLLPENYYRVPGILKNKAIVYKNRGELERAFQMLDEAYAKAEVLGNTSMMAQIYGEKASSHRQNKQLNLAITYLLKSIEILENTKNVSPEIQAAEKQKLANTYLETNQCDFAIKLFKEVLPVFKKVGNLINYYITQVNLADCLSKENNFSEALSLLNDAYNGLKEIGNLDMVSFAANKTAKVYELLGLTVKAEAFHLEAYTLSVEQKSVRSLLFSADYMEFLLKQNRNYDAETIGTLILESDLAKTAPLDNKIYFYKVLTSILQTENNFEQAFFYSQLILEMNEMLQARYDKSTSLDLQAKYQNQIQQQENLILAQKISIQNRNIYILAGLVLASLFISFFIWRVYIYKGRLKTIALAQKEAEARELNTKFNYQKDLNELKEKTIEKQKQELLATALEKIELNEKLESIIQKAENTGESKLKSQLENLKKQDKYWESLISKFYNLHPEFVKNIKDHFPELSKSEVDFCSLVKMNFSFKEIASILQISHDSVISKKYRISKKMNLSGDDDFYAIIHKY